jgi:tRNA nucleotidyltransferase (CCA-adding enzyme)
MTKMAKSGELKSLTAERVWQETKRSLQEKTPEVFFQVLSNVHALEDWFCEIVPTIEDAVPALALSATIKTRSNTDSLTVRFAALTAHLSEDEVKSLCTRLKVQNQVSDVALLVCKFKALLLEEDKTAQALLTLFNGCDAWRRAERFLMVLDAVAPYAQYHGMNWDISRGQTLLALNAATQVDVQQIIAQGIKGPAIKPALEEARLAAIAALIVTQ